VSRCLQVFPFLAVSITVPFRVPMYI